MRRRGGDMDGWVVRQAIGGIYLWENGWQRWSLVCGDLHVRTLGTEGKGLVPSLASSSYVGTQIFD